jgi:hypothetical protein
MFGNKKGLEQKLGEQGGVVAWATVIDADTGWTSGSSSGPYRVGNNSHMKVTLHVEPEGQPAFEATFHQTFSREIPIRGWRAKVIFDPNDHGKIAIQTNQIFPPGAAPDDPRRDEGAEGAAGGELSTAEQSQAVKETLQADRARGRLDQEMYDQALLRLSNLEKLNAGGQITDRQFSSLIKAHTGVTVTSLFPTSEGLKQVVLKEDGTVIVGGAVSIGHASPAPASTTDELEKLADLKAKGLLTDAEFTAAKQKILGV